MVGYIALFIGYLAALYLDARHCQRAVDWGCFAAGRDESGMNRGEGLGDLSGEGLGFIG